MAYFFFLHKGGTRRRWERRGSLRSRKAQLQVLVSARGRDKKEAGKVLL